MTPFRLLVLAIAVYRATRLVTFDVISEPLRKRIAPTSISELRGWRTTAYDFLTCPWCVTVWIAAGAIAAFLEEPTLTLDVAYVLACSAVAGLLAERS